MTHSNSWTLQDAKAQFSHVVGAAVRGQAQRVTKHGKEAVVIISATEFAALKSGRVTAPASFIDHLLAMPKQSVPNGEMANAVRSQRQAAPRAGIALRELDLT